MLIIICSKAVSEWLKIFGLPVGGVSLEEGSPLDAAVYYSLIAAAVYVLHKRQASLAQFIRNNGWLTAFFRILCYHLVRLPVYRFEAMD
jgi:hypothetical protein